MKRYLIIDCGNTACKLTVALGDGECLARHVAPQLDRAALDAVLAKADLRNVDGAIFCSVSGPHDDAEALLGQVARKVLILDHSTPLPIDVSQYEPAHLGLDRIAAAVGASVAVPRQVVLVVDAGTAITYDVVTPDRCFIGGNIGPGISMSLEALHAHTAALPAIDVPLGFEEVFSGADFALTTRQALINGVVNGVVGAINYYLELLEKRYPDSLLSLVVTGGDAMTIFAGMKHLQDRWAMMCDPNLVNEGLLRILKYNESK